MVNRYQSKLYNAEVTLSLEVVYSKVLMCKIKLLIRYTRNYPKTAPTIEIIESERLPQDELDKLEELIEEEIEKRLRRKEPMIFDLCQSIMESLNAYAEMNKKFIYRVDMTCPTMWDERQEKNKTKGLG